jgi:hypothetical protein
LSRTTYRRPVRCLRPAVLTITAAAVVAATGLSASAAPPRAPGPAQVPQTLAQSVPVRAGAVVPGFPVDYVAVTWDGAHGEALVRFRHGSSWTGWQPMGEDGLQRPGGFSSALVPADDADAYQVRIPTWVRGAESVAINTTDGPATPVESAARTSAAAASSAVPVVSRAQWGADENLRYEADGTESWPEEYFPVQKLTVHHTAGRNADPDPAATVRAIYRYHAVDNGWGDIGYQFLVDEAGRVYEGRHTDEDPATPPGFDAQDRAVVGAHVSGWNSGNVGVSLLGTLTAQRPTAAAQRSLELLLADLSTRTGVTPQGSATYTNPSSGTTWTGPNIPGHRNFAATECPGGVAYALLPTIRQRVAARQAGSLVEDTRAPVLGSVRTALSRGSAVVRWSTTGDRSDSQVQYWPKPTPGAVTTTPLDLRFVEAHAVTLSGLRARTVYQYRVVSTDVAGNRTVGATGSFTSR